MTYVSDALLNNITLILFSVGPYLAKRHSSVSLAAECDHPKNFSQMRCEHKSFDYFRKSSLKKKEKSSLAFLPYHLDFNIDVMTGDPAANLGQGGH